MLFQNEGAKPWNRVESSLWALLLYISSILSMSKILYWTVYASLVTSIIVFNQTPKLIKFSFIPFFLLVFLMVIYNVTNRDSTTSNRAETADGVDAGMFNECSDDFGDGDCGGDSDGGGDGGGD